MAYNVQSVQEWYTAGTTLVLVPITADHGQRPGCYTGVELCTSVTNSTCEFYCPCSVECNIYIVVANLVLPWSLCEIEIYWFEVLYKNICNFPFVENIYPWLTWDWSVNMRETKHFLKGEMMTKYFALHDWSNWRTKFFHGLFDSLQDWFNYLFLWGNVFPRSFS